MKLLIAEDTKDLNRALKTILEHEGYDVTSAFDGLAKQTDALLDKPKVFGFCYTQLTDIEQEQNGVCTFGRVPKAPVEMLRRAFTAGSDKRK